MTSNPYTDALGIRVPILEEVATHRDANTFAMLIVALLERGAPMTLAEVAERFVDAGIAEREAARLSLRRCKPARDPVVREGDHYVLDVHSDELDLWLFRLDLRPPRVPRLEVVRPAPDPIPGPEQPLSVDEVDTALRTGSLWSWSPRRLAMAVLDAHGAAMPVEDVVGFVAARTSHHMLRIDSPQLTVRNSPIRALDDGRLQLVDGHEGIAAMRIAVRERIATSRNAASSRPDPAVLEATRRAAERHRARRAEELSRLRRVVLRSFPVEAPSAVSIVDVQDRRVETLTGDDVAEIRERLAGYDVIAAVDVRGVLRGLGLDPSGIRLAELGPPQKTIRLNKRGRTLKITTGMLISSSCGISKPLGDEDKVLDYLDRGDVTRLRRRLEADAKALFALYEYGRLHGTVRLRWGFLDESFRAPWVYRDEPTLYDLKSEAEQSGSALEIVRGSAPGWENAWSRAQPCVVFREGYALHLVAEDGYLVDDREVQAARLARSNLP